MPDGMTTAERSRLERRAAPETVTRPGRDKTQADRDVGRGRLRRGRKLLRWALIIGGALVLVIGGLWYWLSGGRYVSTTDAYVEADVLNVATDVSGIVADIPVHDGEQVKAGQVLFRLDPLKFQLAVDQAKAQLQQAELNLESLKADYTRALRQQAAQEAMVASDQATLDRYATLVKSGAVTKQEYDDARYKLEADQAQVGSSQAQVKAALARLGGKAETPITDMPAYKQAEAQLGEAEREMRHSVVRAPYDGTVTQVSKLQLGQFLPAGTPAFGLVGTTNFWVEAQPKETSLTHAREGDPATVTVDAYPGITWHGTVASIAPATDQQFSVLPAENSSGNWVKVVQRVPVKIVLKPVKDAPPLTAGMSAEVSIDTNHKRTLADLF
ncbi:MAG TPA: HlyD family secretion protein [Acetobacteraceae bacterium]|nr:HlyD family secretion protein [Acetobacteraceae bacterium]